MKRLIAAFVFASGLLLAQNNQVANPAGDSKVTVYLTQHGKTYHTSRDCIGLKHGKIYVSDEHQAQVHGLTLCSICAHRKHVQAAGGVKTWAKEEGK